jgi:hypothetical protein
MKPPEIAIAAAIKPQLSETPCCLSRLLGEENAISGRGDLALDDPTGSWGREMLAAGALLSVFRGCLVHDRFLLGLLRDLSIRAAGEGHGADRAEATSAELQNFAPRGLLAVVFHGSSLVLKLLVFLGRFPVLIDVSPSIRERGFSHESPLAQATLPHCQLLVSLFCISHWRVAATVSDI